MFTDGRADAPTRGQGRHAGVQAAGEREREREIHTQTDIQTYRYTDRVIPCIGAIGDESTHILVEAFAYAF